MTKSINHSPDPNFEPEKPKPFKRLVNKLKSSPKTIVTGGITIAFLGSLGYWGTGVLVKQKLPRFLENQIGTIIKRPIDLGEVKSFSLRGIEFGKTVIPPTPTDKDKVTVEGVKVGFNIFPVLFRRTLPLDVALIQPNIYLEQEEDGEWINLDFLQSSKKKKDPLIYLDGDLDIKQANITAVPYEQKPIQAQVDGNGRFNQKDELIAYDLDATIEKAKATIQGETQLQTGTTDTKLLVKDLALSDVATLLPNSPVEINTGRLNADLDINIPSLKEITAANIQGMVNLENVKGEATDINSSIAAESKLNFSDRNGEIKQTEASIGNIIAQVDGKVNLDQGYDLDLDVLPFQLASIPSGLTEQIPVNLAGEMKAEVKLRGAIKEPTLAGKIVNTQTVTLDKTPFKQINADFRADLTQVVLENVQLTPVAGGDITAQGIIQTNLKQVLGNKQAIDIAKMPLAFNFQADLPTEEIVSSYYPLPKEVAIGDFKAQGQVDGTVDNPKALVKWNIPKSNVKDIEDIAGSGKVILDDNNLSLGDTVITYGEGKADLEGKANLDSKQWQTNIDANSLNLTPFLAEELIKLNLNPNRPVTLDDAKAKFNGRLDQLDLDQIKGTADLNLDVDGGDVVVNSQLNSGNLQTKAVTNDIQLDPFLTSLPVAASLQSGEINASGRLKQLLAYQDNPDLNTLKADADLNLNLDGEAVTVNSSLDSGIVKADAHTNQINLNRLVPDLPIPANIKSSQVTASVKLAQLLTFAENPDLSSIDARGNADLYVAQGTAKAIANLKNNQWQANIDANNISSQVLLNKLVPSNLASVDLDNINAQADLTGDIQPVLNNQTNIPITVNNFTANSGAQNINAKGNVTLSNITSNLDIANTNLDVDANLDFASLPLDQVIAATTEDNQLIAESINIKGKGIFDGQFQGKQLLSTPNKPGNINLTGDLKLEDFAFNDITFDPAMTGQVKVKPGKNIALDLQGEKNIEKNTKDIIAASAVACKARKCRLPYIPTNLELRQGKDTKKPVIATGDRSGDIFTLDINNFPLALLNLAPGKAAGIDEALGGKTTGDVELNLYTLAAQGDIKIYKPGVGYIQANQLNASFNYNPARNIAEITNASLDLGKSKYNLNAALDLESGAIDGKLNIPEAYIQDLLKTLRWFTIEDIIKLFNIPNYAKASAVKPASDRDTVDESIAKKLNLLRQINRQIQANAAAKEIGAVPTSLDIKGKYEGEISLGGTIQTPKANFKVEGNNWQWQPRAAYPDIVEPLGLVIEKTPDIAIPKLIVAGNIEGTTVDLAQAQINLQQAILSLKGKLSPEQLDAQFKIANLTVDNLRNFADIPLDLTGDINSSGTVTGTSSQPQLGGEVAFSDGALNGNVLPEKIAGDFDYDVGKLAFNTTAPDSIQLEATVPYPIIPGKSDRVSTKVNLDKEAFVFLSPLSQKYLSWNGGEGNAQLEANARLDLAKKGMIYDLDAKGVVNLEDAKIKVKMPFLSEPFIGTGKITLNNQMVNVETLNGNFAEKDVSITGKLPILTPVANLDNPLTVNLPPGKIKINKLYQGGVDGKIKVTGTSIQPVIAGKINLEDGRGYIPKTEIPTKEEVVQITKNKANQTTSGAKAETKTPRNTSQSTVAKSDSFITTLQDLKINLKDFRLEETPLYKFQLNGDLTLNGTIDKPSNVKPQGKLILTRADVDLLSSTFNIARDRQNTIIFTPKAGILNPSLDVVLKTEITEVDDDDISLAESNTNEIPDPFSRDNNANSLTVLLNILGETAEILPNLEQESSAECDIRPTNSPLVNKNKHYDSKELNRLSQCFNKSALNGGDNSQIINSPAVKLTSIPARSQGEIISLFGNKFLAFADQVRNSSQEELFDLGVNQFIIAPISRSLLYKVDDTVVGIGKKAGLDYLRILPNFEGIIQLNQKSSIRSTYNYALQEVKLEYEKRY